jgi:iron complex transport system substrate-binding protein
MQIRLRLTTLKRDAPIIYRRDVKLTTLCATLVVTALIAGCAHRAATPGAPSTNSQRIVSLAPSVTETLFALGAGREVVGVSQYCDYPREVLHLPHVGSFLTPNIEAIAALRPSLVIGLSTSSDLREIHALNAMGIATLMADDGSVAAIEQSTIEIGDRIGRDVAARALVAALQSNMAAISERLQRQRRRTVLMVVGHQPMVAVGRGTFLDELLTMADAANIADASDQAWPRLSLEYIIAMRPDVILDGQMGSDPTTPSRFWSRYSSIPAVQTHRVFGYPENPTLHPGPRIGLTLDLLARRIHPEAFDPSRPNEVP